MLFVASVCAMAFTILLCRIPRYKWPSGLEQFFLHIKYGILGNKELVKDWIEAKYNKKVTSLQTGRVAIVTGGSRGIGFEIVKMLLGLNMNVIIACRNPSAGNAAILKIRQSGIETGNAKVYTLDNSSMESVKKFASEVKKDFKAIHVLINNAGIMFHPYELTIDGFEQHWAVNYLSHFLLTSLLLPLLNAGGSSEEKSRVINVTSCAHFLGEINYDDINYKNRFIAEAAYGQSKLAQVIFTQKLQIMLKENNYNIEVFSVHPGIVYTDLFMHSYIWRFRPLLYYLIKNPEQGAMSTVYTAISKDMEGHGGAYISNCRETAMNPIATVSSAQDKLFKLTLEQLQLKDFFQDGLQG